jgi:hypothetical protein
MAKRDGATAEVLLPRSSQRSLRALWGAFSHQECWQPGRQLQNGVVVVRRRDFQTIQAPRFRRHGCTVADGEEPAVGVRQPVTPTKILVEAAALLETARMVLTGEGLRIRPDRQLPWKRKPCSDRKIRTGTNSDSWASEKAEIGLECFVGA